jgi:hypothetical protein
MLYWMPASGDTEEETGSSGTGAEEYRDEPFLKIP